MPKLSDEVEAEIQTIVDQWSPDPECDATLAEEVREIVCRAVANEQYACARIVSEAAARRLRDNEAVASALMFAAVDIRARNKSQ